MLKRLNTQMKKSAGLRIIILILGCVLLGGLFVWGIFSNFGFLLARSTPFPINMHSSVQANYQKDPDYMQIPPMEIQLVIDAVWDLNLNSQNLSTRLTQVNDNFLASVASVTPQPSATDTSVPEFTPNSTQFGPTTTVDMTPPFTPTETPIGFVASATVAGAADTPTITLQSPTNTPLIPTNTVLPPTTTVSPCSQLSLTSFSTDTKTKKASWNVINNSSSLVSLKSISLTWPAANAELDKIFFGNNKIWDQTASPPSIIISSGWLSGSRELNANSSKIIVFTFQDQAVSSGYNLTINLDGCVISGSN